jgi:flagellar motor switch protein FliN/FliY
VSDGILSQDEINALLAGGGLGMQDSAEPEQAHAGLSQDEADAIGEIGNVCLGSAATALSRLVNRKVSITTPSVTLSSEKDISSIASPQLLVKVEYNEGIHGVSIFLIALSDAGIIADLMMGGDGSNPPEIDEIRLSAVGEAMNQMMGAAATSLAGVMKERIGISTPFVKVADFSREEDVRLIESLNGETLVEAAFRLNVEDLVSSEFIQIMPREFSQRLVDAFYQGTVAATEAAPAAAVVEEARPAPRVPVVETPAPQVMDGYSQSQARSEGGREPVARDADRRLGGVQVQSAEFAALTSAPATRQNQNIHLLMDVALQVTVELGRTKMLIKDILELGKGSLVELEKFAGEPVDVLVNGKIIAKGEVVVIDENFGVKIVDIVTPVERVHNLQ